jgi:MOSC domain-containing protein YiiM
VLREGTLQAGDAIEVSSVPAPRVTAADVTAMYYGEHVETTRIVAAPELAAHWREWVAHRTIWDLDEEHKRAEQGGDSA